VVGPTVGVKHLTSTDALILLGFVGHEIGLTDDVILQNRDNLVEKHLTFRLAHQVRKFAEKPEVCLVFVVFNFPAFSLIRPLPHPLGFGRYPMRRSGFAAQRHACLVRAA
jgi:hypothetical protein